MTKQKVKAYLAAFTFLLLLSFSEAYTYNLDLEKGLSDFSTSTLDGSHKTGYFQSQIDYFFCIGLDGSCRVKSSSFVGVNNTALHVNMTFHLNTTFYVNETNGVNILFNTVTAGDRFKIGFRQDGVFKGYSGVTYQPISDTFNQSQDMGSFSFNGTFNEVEIFAQKNAGDNADFLIREINFTYFADLGQNTLPYGNVTYGNYSVLCFNDTEVSRNVPVNFSLRDDDNDTIFLSVVSGQNKIDQTIAFNTQSCWLGICLSSPDYSFIDDYVKYQDESCKVCKEGWNSTCIKTGHALYFEQDEELGSYYRLTLKECVGDPELYFSLDTPSPYFRLQNFISRFDVGGEFNITLYAKDFNKITQVIFRNESGRTLIYSVDSSGEILRLNVSGLTFTRIALDNMYNVTDSRNYTIRLTQGLIESTSEIPLYDSALAGDVSFFSFGVNNGTEFSIGYMELNTITNVINYTTSFPTSVVVYNSPHNIYDFFITDTYHKSTGYNKIEVDIKTRTGCIGGITSIGNPDLKKATENKDVLGIIKSLLGRSLKDYLKGIGEYESGKTLLYTLWFIFFVGLIIVEYGLTTKIDFTFPLAVSSIACFFIAFLVDYIETMIVFLFLIALSLAGPLAGLYKRGHHER